MMLECKPDTVEHADRSTYSVICLTCGKEVMQYTCADVKMYTDMQARINEAWKQHTESVDALSRN